ncbi:MAG: cysteine desulfurase NifS [Elusimicrobia bacterium]|nr:cysteine desulfurase NifS [Elusimicrobiota bacterium]
MQGKIIYLDHSATTPLDPEALETMNPFLRDVYGNASSIHSLGQEAKKYLENARETFAKLINAESPEEIIFTSSGTESDNLAIKGTAFANKEKGNHIITSSIEHHAVLNTCEYLEENGFEVTYLPVDEYGAVNPKDVKKAINAKTVLVSIMHANNEVGTLQPIKEIAEIIRKENDTRFTKEFGGIYFHTDAVQTAGKIKIDVQSLGVDLLSVSAHKFYGPKGVGALYRRNGTRIVPILHGGHHERNLRAGTENVAGIAGMVKALELSQTKIDKEQERILLLRDKLEKEIIEKIPYTKVNGHSYRRVAGISNISFEFIEGESLVVSLDLKGIECSTGSACASGSTEASHVLKAMCLEPALAQGAVRFSLGKGNTEEDIDYVLKVLPEMVVKLREISPLWKQRK